MASPHAWPWFCHSYLFVSLLPCGYHRLMVVRYHCKWEKFQVAKWWSTDEHQPVWEMERVMDVELFLGIQDNWAEYSPHHLVVLYEMFRHVAIEGWKEVEQIICQDCWQNMPQLNLEVGIPAIQLVGLETTKEELLGKYLEVYKLHRPPRLPPGELVILKEVMASLPDSPRCEEEKAPAVTVQPHPGGSHFSRGGAPHRRRNNDSVERSLAMVHEAHQKALAMVTTLEEEIERLGCTRNCSKSRARSKSRDCWRPSRKGQKKRCHQVWFEEQPAPSHSPTPKYNRVRRVWWWRLWLGGTARTEADGSLLPERVAGDSWEWGQEDASRACNLRLWLVGPMEGREMQDPRMVDETDGSARKRRL